MTFRFCDGLDSYASAANLSIRYTLVNNVSLLTTGGRFGGGAISNATSNPYAMQLTKSLSIPSGAKIRIGFSIKYTSTASPNGIFSSNPLVAINGSQIMNIATGGYVAVTVLGSNTAAITSSVSVIDNSFHWIEVEYWLNGASSFAQLYIDGVSQGSSSTNLGTAAAVTTMLFSGGYVFGGNVYLDDLLVWDDQGSTFNTFPLGPRRISTLLPNADGDLAQFTPKSGTAHYAMVNGGYTSGNYVSDSGTGNVDLYKYPSLAYTPSDVTAVVGNYYGQNSGSGTTSLIPKLKTSGSTVSGSTLTLPVGALTHFQSPFTTDAGGTAWTASAVNAMQLGMGD
jgi:hypothetical protein